MGGGLKWVKGDRSNIEDRRFEVPLGHIEAHRGINRVGEQMDPVLENNFTYHKPFGTQPERYVKLRDKAKELAYLLKECSSTSREQSIAMTNLEQFVFWANAAIARNEKE
jgi:hypothetical protein